MSASPTPRVADYFADSLQICLTYARALVNDIPSDRFARMPAGVKLSHPAFCLGHITVSSCQVLGALGREDLAVAPEGWDDLFLAGVECADGDDRYPQKDEIVAGYLQRHSDAVAALRGMPDELFARDNPAGGDMAEMFPSLGSLANFVFSGHHMSHLGQISGWRRIMGMGPALDV